MPTSPGLTWQLWWHIRMPGSSPEADPRDRSGGWCKWGDTGKGRGVQGCPQSVRGGCLPWGLGQHFPLCVVDPFTERETEAQRLEMTCLRL